MKRCLFTVLVVIFSLNLSFTQAWMTNLDIAQRLALVQNKMVLMVWEETTTYQYPVLVRDQKGRTVFINNLFEDEYVSPLIWEYFVPVIVSEYKYADLYQSIKGKRSQKYIDKFNDDSIKILDANGNILNTETMVQDFQNITTLIKRYGLNTTLISEELNNYKQEQSFYSAYYLAAKYLDFALYTDRRIRNNIVDLSNIYLDEAKAFISQEPNNEHNSLRQRSELLRLQEFLVLKRPKRVIRQLKKIDEPSISQSNKSFVAFLHYTAFMCNKDYENAELWKSKVSLIHLKKAQKIININS